MEESAKMLADIEEFFLREKSKENSEYLEAADAFAAPDSEKADLSLECSIELSDGTESAAEIFKRLQLQGPGKPGRGCIQISSPDLSPEKVAFISQTVSWVSTRIDTAIIFDPGNIEECTHLILETGAARECRKSYPFVLGVLLGKRLVSFNWYLDIFDAISTLSLETITLLNLVQGDAEGSDIAELIYLYGVAPKGFFSGVNIQGYLPEYLKRIVHALGGTTQKQSRRPSIRIDSDEMFYQLITGGSKTPWHSLLFPARLKLV